MSAVKSKGLLFALDPSMTRSGWAVFSLTNSRLLLSGCVCPPGPQQNYSRRLDALHEIVKKLFQQLELGKRDIFICEGPAPLVHNPISALKVEQVRGTFESLARVCGSTVPGRLNPRTIHSEILGLRGPQLPRDNVKRIARQTAQRLFEEGLAESFGKAVEMKLTDGAKTFPQDIVDAALVGVVALARIQRAQQFDLDLYDAFSEKQKGRRTAWRGAKKNSGWSEKDLQGHLKKVGL